MEEIKQVLLVVNPISGDIDKKEVIPDIEKAVKKSGADLKTYRTCGDRDLIHLKHLLKNYHPDRVIAMGGDGTIKLVAEAVIDRDIPVGIIPLGSANGLAVNLKIPMPLSSQLEIALGPVCRAIDLLEVDGELCLHMGDLGLNAELIQNYESSRFRGKFGYLLQSIPTLMRSKYPFTFGITTNGKEISREGVMLAFANFNKYGTGATINPQGRPDDGIFELVLFKNLDFIEILKTLRNEVRLDPEVVELIPAQKARITCKTPVAFQVDGEYLGEKKTLEVTVSPRKLRIFCTSS